MRSAVAKVVPPDEVEKYFDSKKARVQVKDGSILVSSKKFEFEFSVQDYKYRVKVWATEDESDSDEAVTREPAKFIAKFLGADIPGGEHFEKMSSSPGRLSSMLRRVATRIDAGELCGDEMLRALRRASVAVGAPIDSLAALAAVMGRVASKEEVLDSEISKIEADMKKKGWDVKRGETDYGHPKVVVDVSGVYMADITFESITYKYFFSMVPSSLGVQEEGETDDPIAETRRFFMSEAVDEASRRLEMESGQTTPVPGFERTMPAEKGDSGDGATVAPKKGPDKAPDSGDAPTLPPQKPGGTRPSPR